MKRKYSSSGKRKLDVQLYKEEATKTPSEKVISKSKSNRNVAVFNISPKLKGSAKVRKLTICPSNFVSCDSPQVLEEGKVEHALIHLRKVCPKLEEIISKISPEKLVLKRMCSVSNADPFRSLCRALISQQLSTKAADSIYCKFTNLCGLEASCVTPDRILSFEKEQLRCCGFSQRKAEYVQSLASFFLENELDKAKFEIMTDNKIRECLIQVRGIGEWTIHMFLMFSLGRQDVLPVGDLIIRKKFKAIFQPSVKDKKQLPQPDQILEISKPWKPYRSVASLLLWHAPS
mmetsp:Transcript_30571/g.37806  ORF Transcript_30571/g.37806 Transcript_30571/m.37806 type:complete len:289 (-) Transcript_30571:191-1057(-)